MTTQTFYSHVEIAIIKLRKQLPDWSFNYSNRELMEAAMYTESPDLTWAEDDFQTVRAAVLSARIES